MSAVEHVIQTETQQRENSPEFKSDRTRTDLPVVKKHSAVCNRGNAALKQILLPINEARVSRGHR